MSRVAVVTDSTSDLPRALREKLGIAVVPLTVFLDGQGYLDGVEIQPDDFYRRLPGLAQLPTTSQPSPGAFAEVYRELLKDHEEVVSIHISARLSGTHAAAVQGAALVDGGRVRVFDSQLASMPLGLLVLAAARLAASGEGAEAVTDRLLELRSQVRVFFVVATLENLRRGGRIGRASALVGSVLQVKPVLTIQGGEVTPLERVRTFDRALARVIQLASEVDSGGGLCAIVGHAAAEESAARISAELQSRSESLLIQPLGPVVGAHAGPGTVGIGCYPAELLPLELGITPTAASARRSG